MRLSRTRARPIIASLVGVSAGAGVLFACTLTQSLDYLQKGDGGAAVIPDGKPPLSDVGTDSPIGRMPVWQVNGQTKPGLVVTDANNVYWLADGKISSVPKATGSPTKLVGTVPPTATALAADTDPTGFVFAAAGTDVLRFPKDGSGAAAAAVVFAPGASATRADTIGADDTSLFVLQYDSLGAGVDTRILRMAKDGGAAADISGDSGATTMTLDPTSVIWLSADTATPQIIQHAKAAPADTNTGVFTLSLDDNLPTLSTDIAVDATSLYWITNDVMSMKELIVSRKRQPAASVISIFIGTTDDTFADLAIDDTYVYTIDTHASTLLRVPKTGGSSEIVVSGLQQPTGLAVDATGIYLSVAATAANGQVLKFAK